MLEIDFQLGPGDARVAALEVEALGDEEPR